MHLSNNLSTYKEVVKLVGGYLDGWVGGCKSTFKDCLQQSKSLKMHLVREYPIRHLTNKFSKIISLRASYIT
jgi:hypothetical protein